MDKQEQPVETATCIKRRDDLHLERESNERRLPRISLPRPLPIRRENRPRMQHHLSRHTFSLTPYPYPNLTIDKDTRTATAQNTSFDHATRVLPNLNIGKIHLLWQRNIKTILHELDHGIHDFAGRAHSCCARLRRDPE
jgi:hypothetical protein